MRRTPKLSGHEPLAPVPRRAMAGASVGGGAWEGGGRPQLCHHGTILAAQKGRQGCGHPRWLPPATAAPLPPSCSHGMRASFAGWWLLPWGSIIHACYQSPEGYVSNFASKTTAYCLYILLLLFFSPAGVGLC